MDQKALTELLFSFKGRINRKKYFLFAISVIFIGLAIEALIPPSFEKIDEDLTFVGAFGFLVYLCLHILFTYIGIAVDVKRLHDLNKSGWFCLFGVIPLTTYTILDMAGYEDISTLSNRLQILELGLWIIWFVYFIILLFTKGTEGENQFGEDPLA